MEDADNQSQGSRDAARGVWCIMYLCLRDARPSDEGLRYRAYVLQYACRMIWQSLIKVGGMMPTVFRTQSCQAA